MKIIVFYVLLLAFVSAAIAKTVRATSVLFEVDLTGCHGGFYIVKFLDSDNIVKHR